MGVALFAALFLLSAGYNDSIDAQASLDTARALVETGSPTLRPLHPDRGTLHEGRFLGWYSKVGLLQPLLYLPAVILAPWFEALGIPTRVAEEFLVGLVNPLALAWVGVWLFIAFRRTTSPLAAVGFAFTFCLGTFALTYAKSFGRETLQALALTGVALSLEDTRPGAMVRAGLWGAVGLLTKQAFVVPLLAFAPLVWRRPDRRDGLLPLAGAIVAWMAYQGFAWGDPLYAGYGPAVTTLAHTTSWSTPAWEGIYRQWFSPDTGLLFCSPLLVVPWIVVGIRRKMSPSTAAAIGAFLLQSLFYARWFSPTGDAAYGPRYLAVVAPILWLTLRDLPWHSLPRPWHRAAIGMAAVAVTFHVVQSSVKATQYPALRGAATAPLTTPHPWANLKLAAHKWSGRPEVYGADTFGGPAEDTLDLSSSRTLAGFDYWWLHRKKGFQTGPHTAEKPGTVSEMDHRSKKENS